MANATCSYPYSTTELSVLVIPRHVLSAYYSHKQNTYCIMWGGRPVEDIRVKLTAALLRGKTHIAIEFGNDIFGLLPVDLLVDQSVDQNCNTLINPDDLEYMENLPE